MKIRSGRREVKLEGSFIGSAKRFASKNRFQAKEAGGNSAAVTILQHISDTMGSHEKACIPRIFKVFITTLREPVSRLIFTSGNGSHFSYGVVSTSG